MCVCVFVFFLYVARKVPTPGAGSLHHLLAVAADAEDLPQPHPCMLGHQRPGQQCLAIFWTPADALNRTHIQNI